MKCPNCNREIKEGMLKKNILVNEQTVRIINLYHEKTSENYCETCGKDLHQKYVKVFIQEKLDLLEKFNYLIEKIPVISTHTPLNWDYEIIGMVTAQSTTGTGFLSEITSSFFC